MDAITAIMERRSVRKYRNEKVKRETMQSIIDLARWAPSWANTQIARYTIVEDEAMIEAFAKSAVKGFTYNIKTLERAKGVAILSYVKGLSGNLEKIVESSSEGKLNTWESFDAGIACQTFCLAAHIYGVGTCIMGIIDESKIAEIISLPENESVAALIVYGYEHGEHPSPTPRLSAEQIVRFL